jgi:hypothetical protein
VFDKTSSGQMTPPTSVRLPARISGALLGLAAAAEAGSGMRALLPLDIPVCWRV